MKKETIVLVVIALVVGVLLGVIYSNRKNDLASRQPAGAPAATAPVVNYQQQIATLEGIVAKDAQNRNAWVQLGHKYFDSDQPMKAIDAYAKALALNGDDPDVLTDQGVMYRRVGWYDKAIANFTKASAIAPAHQQSLYNLGIVYRYDLKDFASATAAWQKLLDLAPDSPAAAQIRGELNIMQQHPPLPKPE